MGISWSLPTGNVTWLVQSVMACWTSAVWSEFQSPQTKVGVMVKACVLDGDMPRRTTAKEARTVAHFNCKKAPPRLRLLARSHVRHFRLRRNSRIPARPRIPTLAGSGTGEAELPVLMLL